jgi:hypothetical protein
MAAAEGRVFSEVQRGRGRWHYSLLNNKTPGSIDMSVESFWKWFLCELGESKASDRGILAESGKCTGLNEEW